MIEMIESNREMKKKNGGTIFTVMFHIIISSQLNFWIQLETIMVHDLTAQQMHWNFWFWWSMRDVGRQCLFYAFGCCC